MFCGNCDFETNLLIIAIQEERLNLKLENLGTCFDPNSLFLADILLGQSHLPPDPGFSHVSIFVYNIFKETNSTLTYNGTRHNTVLRDRENVFVISGLVL